MPELLHGIEDPSTNLAQALRHEIVEGKHRRDLPLPSFRDLAARYGVSLRVVRSALDTLEREGFVYRHERRGTFVRGTNVSLQSSASSSRARLRCINFVERPAGTLPGFVRMGYLRGYTEALEQHETKMRIVACPSGNEGFESLFSPHFPFTEQGCVLINLISEPLIRWLNERGIAFVVQNHACYPKRDLPEHHSVSVNKVGGGFLATQHLLQLGHRRIGFMGRMNPGPVGQIHEGYRMALQCAGIEENPEHVLGFATDEWREDVAAVADYLREHADVTAVVTETDMTAIAVVNTARRIGRHVPEDLSVVGYNDQVEAAMSEPALTTVSNHMLLLGRTAVEMVLTASQGGYSEAQTKVLSCRLVERQTTARG